LLGVASRDVILALLKTRIDEIANGIGDGRIRRMVGVNDRHAEPAHKRDELRVLECGMAYFDGVAKFPAVERFGQEFQEGAEIGGIEFLGRRELPEQGTELVAEHGHARIEKALDRVAGFREHAAVCGEAGPFDRENEVVRHVSRPFGERGRLLRAIVSAIDLKRGDSTANILQLFGLWQFLRVEHAAPGLECPATYSRSNGSALAHRGLVCHPAIHNIEPCRHKRQPAGWMAAI
jgi:hypothetical protein